MKTGEKGIVRKVESAVSGLAAGKGAALLAAALAALAAGEWLNAAAARKMTQAVIDGYREVRSRLDDSAMARHDFRKHMTVLQKMLSDGQTERAIAYLDALSDSVGQRIMRRIVERYHGVMEAEHQGKSYRLSLLLPARIGEES